MVEVWLPYGRTEVSVNIPDEGFQGIIESKDESSANDQLLAVSQALEHPVDSKPLDSLVSAGEKVAIVVDDATRPAVMSLSLDPLMTQLSRAGVKMEDTTVIVGTGMHRPPTDREIAGLVGADLVKRVRVVGHNCKGEDLMYVGDTSRGTKVYLNKEFVEADVRILTGDVELHYFAGYGGGRKSVLPGISGAQTIAHNHALLLHPKAQPGILDGNPVNEDMAEAATMAKVDFILNVVLNRRNEIARAFSGNLHKAFMNGVQVVDDMCKVPCEATADIAVVSPGGSPRDVNLYQALKAVHHTLEIVNEGGAIVLIAECSEGHGNDTFREWMIRYDETRLMEQEIKKRFVVGGHKAYYLTKALQKVKIYLLSTIPDHYASSVFKLRPSRSANAALQTALRVVGKDSKVVAIPHGATTLPVYPGDDHT